MTKKDLSVVVITRNEEKYIGKCLESVLEATKDIGGSEIILVDSASTDKTIEIAMNYPVSIIQLDPSWPLSPAAGRYIGFIHSTGKYVHFQDGDTTLDKNWFKNAIPVLEKDKYIAGVLGKVVQQRYNNPLAIKWANAESKIEFGDIEDYEEDATFRREVLEKVKPFNPYLKALEEGELAERIKESGFKLIRIPYKMSEHYGGEKGGYMSILKIKLRHAVAKGQKLRLSLNNRRIFWKRFKQYKLLIIFLGLLLYLLVSGFFIMSGDFGLLFAWIAGFSIFALITFYEVRNFKTGLIHILSIIIQTPFFLLGLIRPIPDIATYPKDVKVIKSMMGP